MTTPKWKDMTLTELDKQYSPSQWSRRHQVISKHLAVITTQTDMCQAHRRTEEDGLLERNVSYLGTEAVETTLDIYHPSLRSSAPSKILVYVHGGYWQRLSDTTLWKDISGWFSDTVTKIMASESAVSQTQNQSEAVTLVVLNYNICPDVSMEKIVEEVLAAIQFVAQRFHNVPMSLLGHSAGAHLCAMVLHRSLIASTSITSMLPITHLMLVSGIYDLEPLFQSGENKVLNMALLDVAPLSPQFLFQNGMSLDRKRKLTDSAMITIDVVDAEYDSPEFQWQSKVFAAMLTETFSSREMEVSYRTIKQVDHFDIMEKLSEPTFELTKLLLDRLEHLN